MEKLKRQEKRKLFFENPKTEYGKLLLDSVPTLLDSHQARFTEDKLCERKSMRGNGRNHGKESRLDKRNLCRSRR